MNKDEPHTIPLVSLRDYLDARLSAFDKATQLAKENVDERLKLLNELRKDVLEERQQFITAELYHAQDQEKTKWRELVSQRLTIVETRSVTWTSALGIFFTTVQILMWVAYYFIHH